MKRGLLTLTLLTLPIACGPAAPPVAPAPPPPPVAIAAPAAPEPKPAEVTPEEKKKAEDARRLAEDRAAMEAVQHRAKADANPDDSEKKGYLPVPS